jgi:hypothetical protein
VLFSAPPGEHRDNTVNYNTNASCHIISDFLFLKLLSLTLNPLLPKLLTAQLETTLINAVQSLLILIFTLEFVSQIMHQHVQ